MDEEDDTMRPQMSKGVEEQLKSETTWRGLARARSTLAHPKVVQWAEEEYYNMPYFIKVITKSADSNYLATNHGARLALPARFVRAHYLKMDKDVTLEDAVTGSTWGVSFQAHEYKNWNGGWQEFAQTNNLHCGNIIVFALVSHSRFLFTVFNDQGCQVIHPSRGVKQEMKSSIEEKPGTKVNKTSFHLPSCPKRYTRVQPKLKIQEDGAPNAGIPAQNIGHDTACQVVVVHKLQAQPKRKYTKFASAAQDNHKICTHMGFKCTVHHREESKLTLNQITLDQRVDSGLVPGGHQCLKGLEQIQRAECLLLTAYQQEPLVEESLPLSEMTMSEADSKNVDTFEPRTVAHLNPTRFTFMSKRRAVTNQERREARNAASRYSRTLRRPNSISVMKESHVYNKFSIEIPRALVILGGTIEFPQPALTLVDSIGRSWEVQWYQSGRHRLALVPKDWALFAVHHFLEEGDACVFEATDSGALIILVRIFRIMDIPDNLTTDGIYSHYSVRRAF